MPTYVQNPTVLESYTLEGGKLTFRTDAPLVCHEVRNAMAAGRTLTLRLARAGKEVRGKVLSVELVPGVTPAQWNVVIRLSS